MLGVLCVVALPSSSGRCAVRMYKKILTLSGRVGVVMVTGVMAVAADSAAHPYSSLWLWLC